MLEQWVPKLRLKFGEAAASCSLTSNSDMTTQEACAKVDTQSLINALDEAKIIYSYHNPKEEIIKFSLSGGDYGITLDEEPIAVLSVYGINSPYNTFPIIEYGSQQLANYYADPEFLGANNLLYGNYDIALNRVNDVRIDSRNKSIDYEVIGKYIRILSHMSYPFAGEVKIATVRSWGDIPKWAEPTIMKLALVNLIDAFTVTSQGVLRIPMQNGYIEMDGGRIMQNLRSKLEAEAMRSIEIKTTNLLQG